MNSLHKRHTKFFKVLGLLFHFSGALNFTIGIALDYQLPVPGQEVYLFQRLQYISYWNLYLQWFYFTQSTINDLMTFEDTDEDETPKCIDYVKTALACPSAMFVCILFWSLHLLDPNLIHSGEQLPRYLNCVIHTSVSVLNLLEFVIVKRCFCSQKKTFLINFCFNSAFITWFLIYNMTAKHWTYPFFKKLNFFGKVAVFSSSCLMNASLCILGQSIQHLLWKQ